MPGYCFAAIVHRELLGLHWRRLWFPLPGGTSRATLARRHWRRMGFPLPGGTSRATLARRHWRRMGFHPSGGTSRATLARAPFRPQFHASRICYYAKQMLHFLTFYQKSRPRDTKNVIKRLYSSKSAGHQSCPQIVPPTRA